METLTYLYVKGSTRSRDYVHCALRTRIYMIIASAIVLAAESSMASGLLRSMLSYILTDSTFTRVSERSKLALQQTEDLLKRCLKSIYRSFHRFAVQLVTALESLCDVFNVGHFENCGSPKRN